LLVGLLIVTDEHGRADAKRRRAQVARRSQHVFEQGLIVGPVVAKIEAFGLLALGDDEFAFALQQRLRVLRAYPQFRGVDGFSHLASVSIKEPLSPLARCSRVAVIPPINGVRHSLHSG
jgi:hypothetical protein